LDALVVERKLESLRRCVARIQAKRPATLAELIPDLDLQDVLVLNLSRGVQLCVDIGSHVLAGGPQSAPNTMGETFSRLLEAGVIGEHLATRLRRAVGFRNIAVHNYDAIDWGIVLALSDEAPKDFTEFGRQVSKLLPPA
jgi:uncharacterized protein YutE (UPF0331/DUF86 family)